MIDFRLRIAALLGACSAALLSACASTSVQGVDMEPSRYSITQNESSVQQGNESGTEMNQIGTGGETIDTSQIAKVDTDSLTVDQLLAYADRCSPGAVVPPPAGLDCSELKLRMQRLDTGDDEVRDALVTLNRLGRSDMRSVEKDLKKGETRFSLESQAIAGGLLDPAPPPPPQQEEDVEGLLDESGLAGVIGTIIARQ